MPLEELTCWIIRYQYAKFGEHRQDYRAAMQAKITDSIFSDGKKDIALENYMIKFTTAEESQGSKKVNNMAIANALLGGVIPPEVIKKEQEKNGNSSISDSTT